MFVIKNTSCCKSSIKRSYTLDLKNKLLLSNHQIQQKRLTHRSYVCIVIDNNRIISLQSSFKRVMKMTSSIATTRTTIAPVTAIPKQTMATTVFPDDDNNIDNNSNNTSDDLCSVPVITNIGFIGLGNMGLPMAMNVITNYFYNNNRGDTTNKLIRNIFIYDTNPIIRDTVLKKIADTTSSTSTTFNSKNKSVTVTDTIESMIENILFDINNNNSSSRNDDDNSATNNSCNEVTMIITMVPDCSAVDNVMSTIQNVIRNNYNKQKKNYNKKSSNQRQLKNSQQQFIFVDCSTVNPLTSRKWYDLWIQQQQQEQDNNEYVDDRQQSKKLYHYVDAPVSGGVIGAINGTLTFMLGTKRQDKDNNDDNETTNNGSDNYNDDNKNNIISLIYPILYSMGNKVIECDGIGNGNVIKLCNNLSLACQMISICEAYTLADAYNVNPTIVQNVLSISTANCWSNNISNNPHPLVTNTDCSTNNSRNTVVTATTKTDSTTTNSTNSTYSTSIRPATNMYNGGFATSLLLKDIKLAIDAAQNKNIHLPTTSCVTSLYQKVIDNDNNMGSKDFSIFYQYLKEQNKQTTSITTSGSQSNETNK